VQYKNRTTKEHEKCKVSTITNNPIGGPARKYWISVGNTAMVVIGKSSKNLRHNVLREMMLMNQTTVGPAKRK
jgi:hypothetical protein